MSDPDVSSGDMFRRDHSSDPLDAVIAGDDRAEFRDLSTVVEDLVSAYVPEESPPRSPQLAALTDPSRRARPVPVPVPRRRQIAGAVAAFAATLTGKVVIAGAITTATVGGLHATDTIDVPLLPDVGPTQTHERDESPEAPTDDTGDDAPVTTPAGTADDPAVPPVDQTGRPDDPGGEVPGDTPAGDTPAGETPAGDTPAGDAPDGEGRPESVPSSTAPDDTGESGDTPASDRPAPTTATPDQPTDQGDTPSDTAPPSTDPSDGGSELSPWSDNAPATTDPSQNSPRNS